MGILETWLNRNSEAKEMRWLNDYEFLIESSQRTYLKELALETCINLIGRTISQTDFRHMKGKKRLKDDWHYILNVRPNTDTSAADFWQDVISKLIWENEVLIIPYQGQLLLADAFYRNEFALYPDTFKDVTVKNFTFNNVVWNMDEVIYLTYNNKKMTDFINGLIEDYANLFGSLIDASRRSYQLRGSINFETSQKLNDEETEKTQKFIDKIMGAVKTSVTAIFPLFKGVTYTEYSNGSVRGPTVEEIEKVKRALIDDVSDILGIPTNLVHGDIADLENSMTAYIKFCINPLIKKIVDELNAKCIERSDYMNGEKFEGRGVTDKDVINHAEAVDKLIASGAFTRNEVRELFGSERSDNPELDEFVITKNYQSASSVEGGD